MMPANSNTFPVPANGSDASMRREININVARRAIP
jgi:hypothetical protein